MFIRFTTAVAATAIMASSAFAADIYTGDAGSYKDEPIIANPGFSWTGLYLGANIGYATGESDISSDDGGFDETPGGIKFDNDGVIGGAQIGYNLQSGNLLIGIEAEGGYLGAEGDKFVIDDPDNFGETEFGAYGVFAARLGVVSGTTLFYGKAGLAVAAVETTAGDLINGTDDVDDTDVTSFDDTLTGFAIGGGIEHAIGSNWTIKAEYLYMNFEDQTTGNDDNDTFKHENDLHTVKIGVNYKFGNEGYQALK